MQIPAEPEEVERVAWSSQTRGERRGRRAPSESTARRSRTKSTSVKRRRGPRAQKAEVGGDEERGGGLVQSKEGVRNHGGQDVKRVTKIACSKCFS